MPMTDDSRWPMEIFIPSSRMDMSKVLTISSGILWKTLLPLAARFSRTREKSGSEYDLFLRTTIGF